MLTPTSLSHSEHEELERVLKKFEKRYTPALDIASLISEVEVSRAEIDTVLESLSILSRLRHARLMKILPFIPASVAISVTSTAIDRYEGGKFWPGFFDAIGAQQTQGDRVAWGDAFLRALSHFDMPRFSDSARTYVAPVLAHAGIPTYCLGDYFSALDTAMTRVGADAAAVATWAVPRASTALRVYDVPVRDFLMRGDEYALDMIDRSLDLLERLRRDADPAPSMLPERMVEAARTYLELQDRRGMERRRGSGGRVPDRARIYLDPLDGEVKLSLPALESVDEDVTWIVTADGHVSRVTPHKSMGGRTIGIRSATHTIARPTRAIHIATQGTEREQEIDLVDAEDPLVLFADDGNLFASHLPLPGGEVWALYALHDASTPHFSDQITHVQAPPLGWTGWQLCRVNLMGLRSIQLTPSSRAHPVRNDQRVTLETIEAAPISRSGGLAIHTARPLLHIPDGVDAKWNLAVVDLGSGRTVAERVVTSHADVHDSVDPFELMPSPVVGRFAVSVRGPLGKGLSRELAVAEGLRVKPSTTFRTFAPGGLQAATVSLRGPGLVVDDESLEFGPQDVEKSVVVAASSGNLDVVVAPVSMAVAIVSDKAASHWEFAPISCSTDDLAESELLVRLPIQGFAKAHVVSDAKQTLQTLESLTKPPPGLAPGDGFQARFPLPPLTDTVRAVGAATVVLGDDTQLRILRIQPPKIASGVCVEDENLVLGDFCGGEVAARAWSLWEPWREPEDLLIDTEGTAPLARSILGVGPIAVALRLEDPWVPIPPPATPDRTTDYFISLPVGENASTSTIALNASDDHPAPLREDDAWALLVMRDNAPRHLFPQPTIDALTSTLPARPARALTALGERADSQSQRVALLVSSTLLWTTIEAPVTQEDPATLDHRLSRSLASSPLLGGLLATRHLAKASSVTQLPSTWAVAREVLGDSYREILEGRADPEAARGRLEQTLLLDAMPPSQYRGMVASMNVVPRAFLDGDSRTARSISLFDCRWRPQLRDVNVAAAKMAAIVTKAFHEAGADSLVHAIQARAPLSANELPVAHSGALSLALAMVARMAARGHEPCQRLIEGLRPSLETFARHAPQVFECDIVLAEAHIAAMLEPQHPVLGEVQTAGEEQ